MVRVKRRLLGIAVAGALVGVAPVAGPLAHLPGPAVAEAHSCSGGYKHAVVGARHKCLKAGQFCSKRYERSYHRYGFHCHTGRLRAA